MKEFLLALQFLTIIPIRLKTISEKNIVNSLICFPLVGLLIGLILSCLNNFLNFLHFGTLASAVFLVISLVIITAGLHLDGLADTSDAMLSRKSKNGMLDVMHDSHVGVMGVLAIVSVILAKIALLFSLNFSLINVGFILMCVLSRYNVVLSIFLFPYARASGKAKIYMEGINREIFIIATVLTLISVFITWQFKGLLVMAVGSISIYLINFKISNKIDGITGDTLGAVNELGELIILFSIVIIERFLHG
ncbi:MAG: adenosylcobinamide-GDP ribazoletransferase [Candidatus Omnitrophota bacterium]